MNRGKYLNGNTRAENHVSRSSLSFRDLFSSVSDSELKCALGTNFFPCLRAVV